MSDKKTVKKETAKKSAEEKVVKTEKEEKASEKTQTKVDSASKKTSEKMVGKKEKVKRKKTVEQKKLDKLKEQLKKKRLPVFRGRFGKKWLRRKSMEKWQKWRYPRGIDISLKKEDGFLPVVGFRTPKNIRGLHPSGLMEVTVRNAAELASISQDNVVRIYSKTSKKNRKQIYLKAKEMGLKILNRGSV